MDLFFNDRQNFIQLDGRGMFSDYHKYGLFFQMRFNSWREIHPKAFDMFYKNENTWINHTQVQFNNNFNDVMVGNFDVTL